MLLVEFWSINLANFLVNVTKPLPNAIILHLLSLLFSPVIHLHLGLLEAVRLPFLVKSKVLIKFLQIIKHKLAEVQYASTHKEINLRPVMRYLELLMIVVRP